MRLLGQNVDHEPEYSPAILESIARAPMRVALGAPAMLGADRWTGYEFSWLDLVGKPHIAVLCCEVPADSPNIVESKSFKLYLNSYARRRLPGERVAFDVESDLTAAIGCPIRVELLLPQAWSRIATACETAMCIDDTAVAEPELDRVDPTLLRTTSGHADEHLVSHLFRSNCPVTGQPDWASVSLQYRGPPIDHASLLRYWLSFRFVREFHEQCVERMYTDIARCCAPEWFAVQARFTRRGGLDIHPLRASAEPFPWEARSWRQ